MNSDTTEKSGTQEGQRRYDNIARTLRNGKRHPTLGFHPDGGDADWWKAGLGRYKRLRKTFAAEAHDRVIDYGCGSLRIGGHFMRYLDRGNYFGLDVAQDLIAIGKELVGPALLADKTPHLAVIGEDSLADAEAFNATHVFSEAVEYHVVPEEVEYYYDALRHLTHAPGSTLWFSVKLADTEHEYIRGCWARPFDSFVKRLAPLSYLGTHLILPSTKYAGVTGAMLQFRRG